MKTKHRHKQKLKTKAKTKKRTKHKIQLSGRITYVVSATLFTPRDPVMINESNGSINPGWGYYGTISDPDYMARVAAGTHNLITRKTVQTAYDLEELLHVPGRTFTYSVVCDNQGLRTWLDSFEGDDDKTKFQHARSYLAGAFDDNYTLYRHVTFSNVVTFPAEGGGGGDEPMMVIGVDSTSEEVQTSIWIPSI